MAQHDYVIANASGATVRADINNMALAISSNNSGSSEPSTTYAYEWWIDTGNNLLKLRNSANNAWITMPFSITANNTVDINGGTIDGTNIGGSSAGTGAFTTLSASSTLGVTGVLTANAGVVIDNITIDGTEIDLSSGSLTLDVAGSIKLDSDGGEVAFLDGGTEIGVVSMGSSNMNIESKVADKDIIFKGIDGSSDVTALTLDMSDAGKAIFNKGLTNVAGSQDIALNANSSSDTTRFMFQYQGFNQAWIEREHSTGHMVFSVASSERFRVADFGRFLVGTTNNPNSMQFVVGSTQNTADFFATGQLIFRLSSTQSGGQSWSFRTAGTGSYGSGAGDFYFVNGAGSTFYYADTSAGTVNGDFVDTSDIGLKENITNTTDGLTELLQLQPRKFDWKDENKGNNINGFVAQEVETVLPNEVTGDNYDADNPYHGSKAINTSGILAVAVKAIQEQQTIIEDLKARIETLEG